MGIYEKFSSDTELEKRGIVLDFGNGEWVRIARMGGGNKKFVQLFESLMKPYRRAFELGTMDDDKAAEIMHEAFAKAIVLEWNITGKDGKQKAVLRTSADPADSALLQALTRGLVGVHEVAGVKGSLEGISERISSQQREMHFVRESLSRVESYLLNHDNK